MAIYEFAKAGLTPLTETRFSHAGVWERRDLQSALRERIDVISPDCMVLAEEFGEWSDSKRRIDLLCLDRQANIVVVELKRDEEGGHMDLQAIRYAAMVSTLTFRDAVDVYKRRLEAVGSAKDPEAAILEFLGWDEPSDDGFGQEVRIVLAAAEFGRELTTAVLWLNEQGLDIRCVRLKPYQFGDRLLVDVQQVIPLPEAAAYIVKVKQKVQAERESREGSRDYTRYNVVLGTQRLERQSKRRAVFEVVRWVCSKGGDPESIDRCIPWRSKGVFFRVEGVVGAEAMQRALEAAAKADGSSLREPRRYFCRADDELIVSGGATYAFTNQWGARTDEAMAAIIAAFPNAGASFEVADS